MSLTLCASEIISPSPACSVQNSTNTDTGCTTTGPTRTLTSIQMTDLATYRCDVTNCAGTGRAGR